MVAEMQYRGVAQYSPGAMMIVTLPGAVTIQRRRFCAVRYSLTTFPELFR